MTAESEPNESLLAKGLEWALAVDKDDCISVVEGKRTAHPGLSKRELAEALVKSRARKAALEGFVTGLPSNPFVAAPAAIADIIYMLKIYGRLTAEVGFIANPRYFDDPDWQHDALLMFAGGSAVSQILKDTAVAGTKATSKVLVRKYISKEVLKTLKKLVLKYFGKKLTQRGILKAIPVLGGVIGGAWNNVETSAIGKRIIRYHFDDSLTD